VVDTGSPSAGWAGAASSAPRLDRRTLLVPGPHEGWGVTLYEGAGEAVIWREGPPPGPSAPPHPEARTSAVGSDAPGSGGGAGGVGTSDRERVARRARGRVRRYAVANRTRWLVTFTYRVAVFDRLQVKRDWASFAREAKGRWPELAWVRVLELHPGGHGLHVHAGWSRSVGAERRTRELAKLWGHGFVDARKIRSKRGGHEDARAAARYLAKYATKERETNAGEHGYEVAQGHQPVVRRLRAWDAAGARLEAIRAMGGELPAYEWESGSCELWRGPPVCFIGW
jgi:hypothetical protein